MLGIPLVLAFIACYLKQFRLLSLLNIAGSFLLCISSFTLVINLQGYPFPTSDFFLLDSMAQFSLLLITTISLIVVLYSDSYLPSLKSQGLTDDRKIRDFYIFFNLFILTMIAISILDNIGWVWIAIEMTTLISALLIGLYSKSINLEAAWKYIILCTVGIFLALLGIVLLISSIINTDKANVFSLVSLNSQIFSFHPSLLKVAFTLIFIGYGTKIGLVPMHTWLPDAYGKADANISASLTAILSPVILMPILRFKHIVDTALGSNVFTNNLFYFFGLISLIFAGIFLVNQYDYKRLLAYSSIENIGFIVLAIGLVRPIAITAAFLHIVFHSLIKTSLFLCTGNLFLAYRSTLIDSVRNIVKVLPYTAFCILVAAFAITGMPPFALFISKFMILGELISSNLLPAVTVLLAFTLVFGSFIHYFNKMVFYASDAAVLAKEQSSKIVLVNRLSNYLAITLPIILIFVLGLYLPGPFLVFIQDTANSLGAS
jgi:hydrogenase-4 component F